jgi:hypothetical protein
MSSLPRPCRHCVRRGFTDEEAGLLVALLKRLIANLDLVASAEASPDRPAAERFPGQGIVGASVPTRAS